MNQTCLFHQASLLHSAQDHYAFRARNWQESAPIHGRTTLRRPNEVLGGTPSPEVTGLFCRVPQRDNEFEIEFLTVKTKTIRASKKTKKGKKNFKLDTIVKEQEID